MGQPPEKMERFENITVTLWNNTKKDNSGTYKIVQIDQSSVTEETKELPKDQRKYTHKTIKIPYRQLAGLKDLLSRFE